MNVESMILKVILTALDNPKAKYAVNGFYYWLPSPNKKPMQLDIYLEDYGIAIEIDGAQHYDYPNSYHPTLSAFKYQWKKDRTKDELCDKRGLALIRIKGERLLSLLEIANSKSELSNIRGDLKNKIRSVCESNIREVAHYNRDIIESWLNALVIRARCAS